MWYEGRLDGESKAYDSDGNLISITIFDKGKFVSRKDMKNGRWIEKEWDDLGVVMRKGLKIYEDRPPKGPEVLEGADDAK